MLIALHLPPPPPPHPEMVWYDTRLALNAGGVADARPSDEEPMRAPGRWRRFHWGWPGSRSLDADSEGSAPARHAGAVHTVEPRLAAGGGYAPCPEGPPSSSSIPAAVCKSPPRTRRENPPPSGSGGALRGGAPQDPGTGGSRSRGSARARRLAQECRPSQYPQAGSDQRIRSPRCTLLERPCRRLSRSRPAGRRPTGSPARLRRRQPCGRGGRLAGGGAVQPGPWRWSISSWLRRRSGRGGTIWLSTGIPA